MKDSFCDLSLYWTFFCIFLMHIHLHWTFRCISFYNGLPFVFSYTFDFPLDFPLYWIPFVFCFISDPPLYVLCYWRFLCVSVIFDFPLCSPLYWSFLCSYILDILCICLYVGCLYTISLSFSTDSGQFFENLGHQPGRRRAGSAVSPVSNWPFGGR